MKYLVVSVIAVALALAGATSILRSHSLSTTVTTAQDLKVARSNDKLPVEDFDDRSLVFPRQNAALKY
jgi:hypothetical protein